MPKKFDSSAHNEDRRAFMQLEAEEAEQLKRITEYEQQQEKLQRESETRETEIQRLTGEANLLHDIGTREALLDRIRQMRNDTKPREVEYPPRTPDQQKQFEAEQEAGRAAVARAEALEAANRERWLKEEALERAKQAQTNPVVHPNPGQNEMYPATGATLGKRK